MSQRLVAACLAVPAVVALLVWASFGRLPYATYQPGGTLDVLGTDGDVSIIQVDGAPTYDDDGQLRMTTVRVSPAEADPADRGEPLSSLLAVWLDGDNAVYPYDAVHAEEETAEGNRQQGLVQMSTSQDTAVAVALAEMDVEVPQLIKVAAVTAGSPADGVLEVDDVIRSVDGSRVSGDRELRDLINAVEPGQSLSVRVVRDDAPRTFEITPTETDGRLLIGITPGIDYEFPFEVKINISDSIGGPSAGLIFSLAVYDELTEGSLTGGRTVAGTGEIYSDGSVGPIGGIQQKIAGARDDGSDLFLVPIDNCADALQADPGDMRLAMAQTMHDARVALDAYAADPDAELPSCEDAAAILAGDSAGAAG